MQFSVRGKSVQTIRHGGGVRQRRGHGTATRQPTANEWATARSTRSGSRPRRRSRHGRGRHQQTGRRGQPRTRSPWPERQLARQGVVDSRNPMDPHRASRPPLIVANTTAWASRPARISRGPRVSPQQPSTGRHGRPDHRAWRAPRCRRAARTQRQGTVAAMLTEFGWPAGRILDLAASWRPARRRCTSRCGSG